jgi:hypothetical protein
MKGAIVKTVLPRLMYRCLYSPVFVNRDSAFGTATRKGLDRIPVEAIFSAPVQTGPGAHPGSYTIGTEFFPGGKAAAERRYPPTLSNAEIKERVDLYFCSPSSEIYISPYSFVFEIH